MSPGEVEHRNVRRSTGDEQEGNNTSVEGTPRREQDEEQHMQDEQSNGQEGPRQRQSSNSTPGGSSGVGSGPEPGERERQLAGHQSDPAKQFPHIEMLQRHMLSQQFPGLINPLLSGFPGFPPGSAGHLPFPNLQHLFGAAGKKPEHLQQQQQQHQLQQQQHSRREENVEDEDEEEREEGER